MRKPHIKSIEDALNKNMTLVTFFTRDEIAKARYLFKNISK